MALEKKHLREKLSGGVASGWVQMKHSHQLLKYRGRSAHSFEAYRDKSLIDVKLGNFFLTS